MHLIQTDDFSIKICFGYHVFLVLATLQLCISFVITQIALEGVHGGKNDKLGSLQRHHVISFAVFVAPKGTGYSTFRIPCALSVVRR